MLDESSEVEGQNIEPKTSRYWLALITAATKAFNDYQLKSDNIDKQYADLSRLAGTAREREMALFWANIQILGPLVYSRPPVPVVTTRFKDRRPLAKTSAELLDGTSIVAIEQEDLNAVMLQVRDDLNVLARGAIWVRLGEKNDKPCVYIDHVARRDFLHDPARTWKEVDWVAKCSWLTKGEARKRFYKTSGNAYQNAAYVKTKNREGSDYDDGDTRLKAPFWELWSKSGNKVVWIAEGCEVTLDEGAPHLDLEGFFPCPQPAWGTLQRGTLIPVPDFLFYKDQIEEINQLTGRIGALTESLRLKGFYPAGAGKLSDAIETAIKSVTNNQVLVPVSDWAMLGTGSPKDMIVWIPVEQVAIVVRELIALRKQLIDDVYQITGLSDIVRGSTEASETLGAQQLKSQYGATRIRDKQNELVRIARDTVRILAEIVSENYDLSQFEEMAQMELPRAAEIKAQIGQLQQQGQQIEAQIAAAQADPQIMAMAQQEPDKAQAMLQQAQGQLQAITGEIEKLGSTVTLDAAVKFLRDNRMRNFQLDIETDSTIQPDENAAKQRATEYMTAMAEVFQQAIPAVTQVPQMAPMLSEMVLFANKQFRVGRTMETAVEEFADQMKQMASQPKPDPNAAAQQAEQAQADHQMQMEQQQKAIETQDAEAKRIADAQSAQTKAAAEALALKAKADAEAKAISDKAATEINIKRALAEQARLDQEQEHQFKMETLAMERDCMTQKHNQSMAISRQDANVKVTEDNEIEPIGEDGEITPRPLNPETQAILAAIASLAKTNQAMARVLSAPQMVKMPDGRIITSQKVLN